MSRSVVKEKVAKGDQKIVQKSLNFYTVISLCIGTFWHI